MFPQQKYAAQNVPQQKHAAQNEVKNEENVRTNIYSVMRITKNRNLISYLPMRLLQDYVIT